jgi:hypothetical protein
MMIKLKKTTTVLQIITIIKSTITTLVMMIQLMMTDSVLTNNVDDESGLAYERRLL